MNAGNLPIACRLTDSELQQRREEVLRQVKAAITGIKETESGFVYEFSSSSERIASLANLIALEHECCPFLSFRLTVEPAEAPVSLEVSGPPGTKDFLIGLFH
jgi:hypothetical protein